MAGNVRTEPAACDYNMPRRSKARTWRRLRAGRQHLPMRRQGCRLV